jgi:RNA polymerase sigma factor for flagellar operon FliA
VSADSTLETIRRHTQLALNIARSFVRKLPRNVLREDLEQAAMIGLFDAARKHAHVQDPTTEVSGFEWYVRRRIRGAVIDELRAQDWLPRRARSSAGTARADEIPTTVVRFDDLGSAAPGEPSNWEDRFAGHEPSPEETAIIRDEYAHALEAPLCARDRKVIDMTERRGMRFKDAAAHFGISEPRISQLHARSIAIMRAHLTGDIIEQRAEPSKREQNEHQDVSGVDRTARGHQGGHPRPEPEPDRVRAGGVGAAAHRRIARAVPRGGRFLRLDDHAPGPGNGRVPGVGLDLAPGTAPGHGPVSGREPITVVRLRVPETLPGIAGPAKCGDVLGGCA